MRLNQYLAKYTNLSRRSADKAIMDGRVEVNGILASLGDIVVPTDTVTLDSHAISTSVHTLTLLLHKPVGYVCSRNGQGSQTIYDLLPPEYKHLNPAGRLDKDSSGLLLLTNDGDLANRLTHPKYKKQKVYEVTLDKPLNDTHFQQISQSGVSIDGKYISKFKLKKLDTRGLKQTKSLVPGTNFLVSIAEGKNRQIRRTFAALGYTVTRLHRTQFGDYSLSNLKQGEYSVII